MNLNQTSFKAHLIALTHLPLPIENGDGSFILITCDDKDDHSECILITYDDKDDNYNLSHYVGHQLLMQYEINPLIFELSMYPITWKISLWHEGDDVSVKI